MSARFQPLRSRSAPRYVLTTPFPSSFSTITFLGRLDETFPIETFARLFSEKNRRSSRTYFDGNLLSNVFSSHRGSWRITIVDFYPITDIKSNVITYHTGRLLATSDTYGYIVLFSIQMSYVEIIFCPVLPYQLSLHMHVPVRNHTLVDTLLWSARFFSRYNDSFEYERTTRHTNISRQLLTNHRSSIARQSRTIIIARETISIARLEGVKFFYIFYFSI